MRILLIVVHWRKLLVTRIVNHAGYVRRYGEDDQEKRPENKGLCDLRAAICMAQEVGKGLGRGALLL